VVAVAHLHGQVLVLGLPDRERLGLRRVDASLWLVDNLALAGQTDRATALFERLLGQANDLGQLAEEIDPASGELLAPSLRPSAMSGSSAPPPTSNAAVEPTELRPADPSRPVLGTDEQLVDRKPSNRAGRRTRRRPTGKPVGPSGRRAAGGYGGGAEPAGLRHEPNG
jgi:hypothetical protein